MTQPAAVAPGSQIADQAAGTTGTRSVVGIGEFAVTAAGGGVIVTHALGSCVAVCIWDGTARVAGLLHFLLPDSRINPQRAEQQPAAFADTGLPLLFQAAYALGADKRRLKVHLVGGAETAGDDSLPTAAFAIGRRNLLAAKNALWRNGVLIDKEEVGGRMVRTVHVSAADGSVLVSSGRDVVITL